MVRVRPTTLVGQLHLLGPNGYPEAHQLKAEEIARIDEKFIIRLTQSRGDANMSASLDFELCERSAELS